MSSENKTLTPIWIVYADGARFPCKYDGALRKIRVFDRLNAVGIARKSEQTNDKQLKSIEISIKSWKNKLFDYYDFKGKLGFPLPNPHYKKIEDGAIHPNKKTVSNGELKHTKLIALEKAPEPLANPFYIYKEFEENDPMLLVKNQIVELYE